MTMVNYDANKDAWYSPTRIIDLFEELRLVFQENIYKEDFKKAREMFTGAVALFGAYELSPENKYFMQINTQSGSPDVMAGKQQEGGENGITLEMVQMEIVDMEEHSKTDDVLEFLKQTKLSPKKAYDKNTMIVCMVNKVVPLTPVAINDALKIIKPKSTVYITGRKIGAQMGEFIIFTPWPILVPPITYNINETEGKYFLPPRVTFHKGMEKKIVYGKGQKESFNIFEVFGLDEKKIRSKYKKDLEKLMLRKKAGKPVS